MEFSIGNYSYNSFTTKVDFDNYGCVESNYELGSEEEGSKSSYDEKREDARDVYLL